MPGSVAFALANSDTRDDRVLAKQIVEFVRDMPMVSRSPVLERDVQRARAERGPVPPQRALSAVERTRKGPEIGR